MASSKDFKPVGHCIYCNSTEGKLSREHIIPFGLGGDWVLPAASCNRCASITSEVERFCLRPMLGRFRIQIKVPTRRPEKRLNDFPIEILNPDGTIERKALPIDGQPIACLGFQWAAPRFLDGKPPEDAFEGDIIVRYVGTDQELIKHATDGQAIKLGSLNMAVFARMLAKIGHAYAVANMAPNSFEPMLPNFILGKENINASYLVGGDKSGWSPDAAPALHSVYLQDCLIGDATYTLARITLFELFGMPTYHVVVGRKLGPPAGFRLV